jgi:hypothetical protein
VFLRRNYTPNTHIRKLCNDIVQPVHHVYKKSLKIPKGVIRNRISMMNRQDNGQKKKYKRKVLYFISLTIYITSVLQ